jgi:hypothetical protein
MRHAQRVHRYDDVIARLGGDQVAAPWLKDAPDTVRVCAFLVV